MGSASSPWEVRRNRGASGHEVVFVYGGRVDRLEEVVTPEGGTFHDGDVPIRVE